jgi:hypothetical protein
MTDRPETVVSERFSDDLQQAVDLLGTENETDIAAARALVSMSNDVEIIDAVAAEQAYWGWDAEDTQNMQDLLDEAESFLTPGSENIPGAISNIETITDSLRVESAETRRTMLVTISQIYIDGFTSVISMIEADDVADAHRALTFLFEKEWSRELFKEQNAIDNTWYFLDDQGNPSAQSFFEQLKSAKELTDSSCGSSYNPPAAKMLISSILSWIQPT